MKLSDIRKVHFIGIGGIGMSGLARLFLHEGKQVSGSDRAPSDITHALEAEGVTLFDSQGANNITADIDLVVYTEAMPHDHEELACARDAGIMTVNYFEALGMVANEYYLIAVAGSHGKTTTTAMLIDICEDAGLDPSAIVGSLRAKTKSNYRAGKSKYFIVEACEYKRDFMSLEPDILVITNIEHEHVDYYKSLEEVQKAFRELAEKVPEDGFIVANLSDQNVTSVVAGLSCMVVDYRPYINPLRAMTMPGLHNQMNAAAAIAAAEKVGITLRDAEQSLAHFAGTWRRFEYKGECNLPGRQAGGAKVYDDYGHHPTEIKATIQGARELYPNKKITIVFQSHRYSRTVELFDDFISALRTADLSVILPIYPVGEENITGISNSTLASALLKEGGDARACNTIEEVVAELKKTLSENDVVITMGAGDMTPKVAEKLVS